MNRGTLVLVVGPSGAGKDTVIRAARAGLGGDGRFVFARRVITRPPHPAEDHEPAEPAAFAARLAAGGFMLAWQAHGDHYGIPLDYEADLRAGRSVIANASRGVVGEAAARFPPLRVVEVTAPPDLLATRLNGRGREDGARIAGRLERRMPLPPGLPVSRIVNDRGVEDALADFLAVLRQGTG